MAGRKRIANSHTIPSTPHTSEKHNINMDMKPRNATQKVTNDTHVKSNEMQCDLQLSHDDHVSGLLLVVRSGAPETAFQQALHSGTNSTCAITVPAQT